MMNLSLKQFKKSILIGHGRCYLALKENPNKYLKIVLWACKNKLPWDNYSSTHSYYMYRLINCYENKDVFLDVIIKSFNSLKHNNFKMLYYAELLSFFAFDNYDKAINALNEKYNKLYVSFLNSRKLINNYSLYDFESLCISAKNSSQVYRIIEDIGFLIENKKEKINYDFETFILNLTKREINTLIKRAKTNIYYQRILDIYYTLNADINYIVNNTPKISLEERIENFHNNYLIALTIEEKIKALHPFAIRTYHNDPINIIADANSDNKDLKLAALAALENIKHPKVKEFALTHLDENLDLYLPIFIANYRKKDEKLLISFVKSINVSYYSNNDWHSIFSALLRMKQTPTELLIFIYENCYCGYCRTIAFKKLKARNLLTDSIKEEYPYDALYFLK